MDEVVLQSSPSISFIWQTLKKFFSTSYQFLIGCFSLALSSVYTALLGLEASNGVVQLKEN